MNTTLRQDESEIIYKKNGVPHRIGKPAMLFPNGQEINAVNGRVLPQDFWSVSQEKLELNDKDWQEWLDSTPELIIISICEAVNDGKPVDIDTWDSLKTFKK